MDALRIDRQSLHDVDPRGVRWDDHRVGATGELVLQPVSHGRVRQHQVVLRPVQRREVVDRDDGAKAAQRRK